MKKAWFFLIAVLLVSSLSAQRVQEHKVKISYEKKVTIDSFHIYSPYKNLEILELDVFSNDLVSTPSKACQAFISFDTRAIGTKLASEDYGLGFPSNSTLQHRKDPEFQTKRYLKIYFVIFFEYNNEPHSISYIETYAGESLPQYYTVLKHKYIDGKWLLVDDWYLSRFRSLSKLKPRFAQSLISGETIRENNHFDTLKNAVYNNNSIDIGVLDEYLSKKEFKGLQNN